VLAVVSGVAIGAAHPLSAQTQNDAASAARVRAGLDKPPSQLTLKEREPDFRIEIHDHERERWMKMFETPVWVEDPQAAQLRPKHATTPDQFGAVPLASVDLLAIGKAVKQQIDEHRRARDQRNAAEEVREEIAAWCAAQPEPATIDICRH